VTFYEIRVNLSENKDNCHYLFTL